MKSAATLLCLMASGASALIYQICWIREASLVLGSTLLATSTVLAVFFLGLALGSEVFGRIAAGSRRPLGVFALLELGLAILGMLRRSAEESKAQPLGRVAFDCSRSGSGYRAVG